MHRFHSQRALNRLKFGSFLYLVFIIAAIALFPAAFWVILLNHTEDTLYLLISLGTAVLSGILCLVTSIGVRCPLCHGPLLANPQCARSPRAKKIFGSYRLGVAFPVLFVGHFRCPCCGEPSRCTTRRR